MGSHFYAELCQRMAQAYESSTNVRTFLDAHAARSRLAIRLLAAAQFRALRGEAPAIAARFPSMGGDGDAPAAWSAIETDLNSAATNYAQLIERPVQTNEPARALPVLGAMLALADQTRLPLRVFEIGSSAGLLLQFDRYRYSGRDWSWGDPDAPVHLHDPGNGGAPEHLDARIEVAARRGCDIHPLDPAKTFDADTLLSFVWSDQTERFERLRAAIDFARQNPVTVDRAEGAEWIQRVAEPQTGYACVVFHTVITEHLPQPERTSLRSVIASIGKRAVRSAPFAWARMEPVEGEYETAITIWPGGDQIFIARSDGHARNLQWGLGLE